MIVETFKKAGIDVEYEDGKFVMTDEKQKFQIILKYGHCSR